MEDREDGKIRLDQSKSNRFLSAECGIDGTRPGGLATLPRERGVPRIEPLDKRKRAGIREVTEEEFPEVSAVSDTDLLRFERRNRQLASFLERGTRGYFGGAHGVTRPTSAATRFRNVFPIEGRVSDLIGNSGVNEGIDRQRVPKRRGGYLPIFAG